jgi:hypothetical protein
VEKKINPAEPLLSRVAVGLDKLKIGEKIKLFTESKKDHLREYLRRTKSARN